MSVCLFVWVVGWLPLPYWFPPSACPPIEWPRWGPRGPALRASRVSGCSSTYMWGPGVHCLHSPSFGEPTGLREQSNDLCPTLRATHGTSRANHLLHRTYPSDTPQDHSSESIVAYRSLILLTTSLREVSVQEKEALCPPPVQVVWQNFVFILGLIINSADTREMWTQSNK